MKLEDYLKNGKALVWPETFAVVKAKKLSRDAFALIKDKAEITWVIEQSRLEKVEAKSILAVEPGWNLITFDMVLPFGLIGFFAKISEVLAHEGVSLFALSAYSTDHILVKKRDLTKAVRCLRSLGLQVEKSGE